MRYTERLSAPPVQPDVKNVLAWKEMRESVETTYFRTLKSVVTNLLQKHSDTRGVSRDELIFITYGDKSIFEEVFGSLLSCGISPTEIRKCCSFQEEQEPIF